MASKAGLMGTAEAGEYLGFSQYWVQTRAKGLGIPHTEINGRYYYKQADLDIWLSQHRRENNYGDKPTPSKGQKDKSPKVYLSEKKSA
jgi:hypothetical protein